MKMKKKRLVNYSDDNHSWLAVKISDLEKLGIKNQISDNSRYRKSGKTAYLEGEKDAPLFLQKLEENEIEYDIIQKNHGRKSLIRLKPTFKDFAKNDEENDNNE